MRNFCDNPLCKQHVEVEDGLFMRGVMNVQDREGEDTIQMRRHDWARGTRTKSLCSVCFGVVTLLTGEEV